MIKDLKEMLMNLFYANNIDRTKIKLGFNKEIYDILMKELNEQPEEGSKIGDLAYGYPIKNQTLINSGTISFIDLDYKEHD